MKAAARAARPLPLLFALLLCVGFARGAELPVPAVPEYATLPLPGKQAVTIAADGELSWLGTRPLGPAPLGLPQGCWAWELMLDRWQPATGATRRTPLALPMP